MLELKNICHSFDSFELKDISFNVGEGEYFVLLGESGAGKSVILELIAGLIKPSWKHTLYTQPWNKDFTDKKRLTWDRLLNISIS